MLVLSIMHRTQVVKGDEKINIDIKNYALYAINHEADSNPNTRSSL